MQLFDGTGEKPKAVRSLGRVNPPMKEYALGTLHLREFFLHAQGGQNLTKGYSYWLEISKGGAQRCPNYWKLEGEIPEKRGQEREGKFQIYVQIPFNILHEF